MVKIYSAHDQRCRTYLTCTVVLREPVDAATTEPLEQFPYLCLPKPHNFNDDSYNINKFHRQRRLYYWTSSFFTTAFSTIPPLFDSGPNKTGILPNLSNLHYQRAQAPFSNSKNHMIGFRLDGWVLKKRRTFHTAGRFTSRAGC